MTEFNTPIKTVGKSVTFDTGAHRDDKGGKGRMDLLPGDAIVELAKHFQKGAEHHGDRNWERGIPLSSYLDSGLRHAFQAQMGYTDEPHAVAACWNFLCYIQTKIWIEQGVLPKSLDDMPRRAPKDPEPSSCICPEDGPTDECCPSCVPCTEEDWGDIVDVATTPTGTMYNIFESGRAAPASPLSPVRRVQMVDPTQNPPVDRIRRFQLVNPDQNAALRYVEFIGDQGYFVWKDGSQEQHTYPISVYVIDNLDKWEELEAL